MACRDLMHIGDGWCEPSISIGGAASSPSPKVG